LREFTKILGRKTEYERHCRPGDRFGSNREVMRKGRRNGIK
jgi:hypothetical protein